MTDPGSNPQVWWDKEADAAGRPIRVDVRTAAHQIWDAARRQTQHLLGDASEAPEVMENAVAQVSRYLDRSGADLFTQNTAGILMCALADPFDAMRGNSIGWNLRVEASNCRNGELLPTGPLLWNSGWI